MESESLSFTAKMLAGGRVTVPESTRDLLGIKKNDYVEITIRKREPVKVGDTL